MEDEGDEQYGLNDLSSEDLEAALEQTPSHAPEPPKTPQPKRVRYAEPVTPGPSTPPSRRNGHVPWSTPLKDGNVKKMLQTSSKSATARGPITPPHTNEAGKSGSKTVTYIDLSHAVDASRSPSPPETPTPAKRFRDVEQHQSALEEPKFVENVFDYLKKANFQLPLHVQTELEKILGRYELRYDGVLRGRTIAREQTLERENTIRELEESLRRATDELRDKKKIIELLEAQNASNSSGSGNGNSNGKGRGKARAK
jgi:flagellar motility protein MotE (MotC chaperone)